ncbi:MAG TPA: hypothetical protein DDZ65_13510, partial [Firmicutes bacterium]|nr:hypothetical protein [Bacillota bacterium]
MTTVCAEKTAFLSGNNIYLRPLEAEDLPFVRQWYNDPVIRGQIGMTLPESKTSSEEWFERINKDKERVWFAVVRKEDDKVIGEAGLLRMYHLWRNT